MDNLVLQCPYCSLHKADRLEFNDPLTREITPLFHPLLMPWRDHFLLTADAQCIGKSVPGRATVAALAMNDPIPRVARALQLMVGIMAIDE